MLSVGALSRAVQHCVTRKNFWISLLYLNRALRTGTQHGEHVRVVRSKLVLVHGNAIYRLVMSCVVAQLETTRHVDNKPTKQPEQVLASHTHTTAHSRWSQRAL